MQKLIIMTVALLLLSGARAQNLLSNGGFELPGLPGNEPTRSLTNGNTLLSGWTIVDDGVGQPPLYVQLPNSDGIIEGTYGLILNQGSGIRTTFRAEAGAFYELSLWHRPDDCQQCVTPAPLQVSISGTVYTLPIIPGWSQRRVQFWATNSVNTLEIVNPSSPADFKQFGLDEVSIMKVPGVVLNINMYPGVILNGLPGQRYQVQAAESLNSPLWITLTNITVTNPPVIFFDADPRRPLDYPPKRRIYRAIQIPPVQQ